MLSRVANSIYWMNRYMERADNYARFIDVNMNLALDLPSDVPEQWLPLVVTTGDAAVFRDRFGEPTRDNVIDFLAFDDLNPNSIYNCIMAARENARTVREKIPRELWEEINNLYLHAQAAHRAKKALMENPTDFFERVKRRTAAFYGIMDASMTHGDGWHFGNVGRFLERADKTTRVVDIRYWILLPKVTDVGTPLDLLYWTALLKSCSAFQMYRIAHQRFDPSLICKFLILDGKFPRSLRYCLIQAESSLHSITASPVHTFNNAAEKKIGQLRSDLQYKEIGDIFDFGLHEFLDSMQTHLNEVGAAVNAAFFAPRAAGQGAAQKQE